MKSIFRGKGGAASRPAQPPAAQAPAAAAPTPAKPKKKAYPPVAYASWPYRLPAGMPDAEVEALRAEVERLGEASQYGWGHTIDFGPFKKEGLLHEHYLRVANLLDTWGWWPERMDGMTVLDVGAFTGGLSLYMAHKGAAKVYAVDEVPEHVEQSRLVAKAFGVDTVEPMQASLYELPQRFAPESVDLILLSGVLYHLSDMIVGLIALQGLLKPGGVLIVESNAVDCFEHSYANFGRFVAGMWWQPTGLCIQDMCSFSGFDGADVRFFRDHRCLARAVKPEGARIPFKRGMNWHFDDIHDEEARTMDKRILAGAPCHHD